LSIFDLLFIVLFLALCGALAAAVVAAVRGRRTAARAILVRAGFGVAFYLGIVALVSVASPRRYVRLGADQCSDDWCVAVTSMELGARTGGNRYDVTFRLSSRARRVAQRERFVVVYLRDADGRRYDPEPGAAGPQFDVLLAPQETVTTSRSFSVPPNARGLGVVVAREGGYDIPQCCIIGDEGSFFHKKTVVRRE